MKIWTGKFCLLLAFVLGTLGCSSSDTKPAASGEVPPEVSLKGDRQAIEEMRKDIPEEKRKINDRLAEMLNRWRAQKMAPDDLREHFDDEIRKMRTDKEREWKRRREDFERKEEDTRRDFQDKQKAERDSFFSSKPNSDKRSEFSNRQSAQRDRFYADEHDARDDLNDGLQNDRKDFEQFVSDRHAEFRDEFPEYSRNYNEMKKAEEEKREEEKENPKPYSKWPYKMPGDTTDSGAAPVVNTPAASPSPAPGAGGDVNKGGNGWPASDPAEFDQAPNGQKQGP